MDIVKGLRKVRRGVAGLTLATLIASFFAIGVVQAQTFSDVNPSDWFYSYVEDLVSLGVVNGSMEAYRPADSVNRAEMAKLVVEAFELPLETPSEPTFGDVPESAWFYSYVETVAAHGIVGGYKDEGGNLTGYYGPGDPVTREQASKMLVLGAPLTINTKCGPSFPDVPVSTWSYEFVETLYVNSVVDGNPDGSFAPGANITRAAVAKIVSNGMNPVLRACGGFSLESVSALSSSTVEVCFSSEVDETSALMSENYAIMDADENDLAVSGVEASSDPMCVVLTTDAQTAQASYDLTISDVVSTDAEDLLNAAGSFSGFSINAIGGDLSVSLSSSTAVSTTVPSSSVLVPWASFDFEAGDEAVELNSLTFKRVGVGVSTDFDGGYLYEGNTRLTNKKNVTSDNLLEFSGLQLEIPANQIRTLTIKMNANAGKTGEHAFSLESATDVTSNSASEANGDFPITGKTLTFSSTNVGIVTLTNSGSTSTKKVGEEGVIMNEFTIATNGTESVNINRVIMRNDGSASDAAAENFTLEFEGEVVAQADVMEGKYIDFVLDPPYLLDKSKTVTATVKGDIKTDIGKLISLYVKDATDFEATGNGFGGLYNVALTNNLTTTTAAANAVTIAGSDINVSFNGPEAQDIKADTDNVVLANLAMQADSDSVNLTRLRVVLAMGAATAGEQLQNLELVDSGNNVSYTVSDPAVALSSNLDFENVDLKQGVQYNFEIRGDVPTGVTAGQTYKASIDFNNVTGEFSNDLTAVVVGNFSASTLEGKLQTIAAPSVTFTPVTTTASTVVKSATGALLFKGKVKASNVSDLRVTKLSVTDTGSIANLGNAFDRLYLYQVNSDGSETKLDDESSLAGVTSVAFSGFTLNVPKGSSNEVSIVVRGDVKATPTAGTVMLQFKAAAVADYSVKDADSNLFTIGQYTVTAGVGQTTTMATQGTFTLGFDVTEAGTNIDKYVSAGKQVLVGRIKASATKENATLKELTIENNGTATSDDISLVSLFSDKEMTTVLATATLNAAKAAVWENNSLNIEIPTSGLKYIYVAVTLKGIDYSSSPTADATATALRTVKFNLAHAKVTGVATGETLVYGGDSGATAATQTLTIADAACLAAETFTATVGGNAVVYTATTADCAGADTADGTAIGVGLAAAITADTAAGALVTAASANAGGTTTITLTAVEKGTDGNAITLTAADTSAAQTLVATATPLAGGADTYTKIATVLGARFVAMATTFANGTIGNAVKDLFSFSVTAQDVTNVDFDGAVLPAKLNQVNFSVTKTAAVGVTAFKVNRVGGANGEQTAKAYANTITVATATNSSAYTVTIGGQACTYTSDASATVAEITDGLAAAINANTSLAGIAAANSNAVSVITVFALNGDATTTLVETTDPGTDFVVGGAALSVSTNSLLANDFVPVNFALTYGTNIDLEVNANDTATYTLTGTISGVTGTGNSMQTTIESIDTNVTQSHNTGTAGVDGADITPVAPLIQGLSYVRGGQLSN